MIDAMEIVTLQAHFDGRQILLDEPYEMTPNTKLVVSVIRVPDEEREDLMRFPYQIWNVPTATMSRNIHWI